MHLDGDRAGDLSPEEAAAERRLARTAAAIYSIVAALVAGVLIAEGCL